MKRVAVTGLGVISPVGNDVPTFWNALCSGTCGIGPITKFDATDYPVKLAAEVRDFDPKQYMEKLDILHSDVYTHFAMAAACQAVADSGIAGTLDAERVGVYIGSGIGGIATFMTEHSKLLNRGPRRVSPYFIPMMIPNMASSIIAMRYHFHGPAMPMVTACASGTNAIGEALRLIRHGYADAMVAGGAEATVNALAAAGFSNMQALSPSEDPNAASLPFDVRRAGFVMGEGAGVVILETLEHAQKRGAKIYGELVGYGISADAYHLTAPDPEGRGAARCMKMALEHAGMKPEDIDYVNTHGTSTPLGDICEIKAIKAVFGDHAKNGLLISSTKSMTGHLLGAAGGVELAACLMAMQDNIIPPTINVDNQDPECDLDCVPNKARETRVDAVLSNSFGFGGHNSSVIVKRFA